jgi:type VI protein secretion system component Hcp
MIKRNCLYLGIIIFVLGITSSTTSLFAEEDGPMSYIIEVCIDKTCFESNAIYFGAFQSGTMNVGGGGGAGKVSIEDIGLIRNPDSFSPNLFLYCASGKHFNGVTIEVFGINGSTFMRITMENVVVTSYRIDTSGNETPREEISLNFAKVCLLVEENEVCWNIEKNQEDEPQNL